MISVEFLGPISEESMQLDISDLSALKTILAQKESLKSWLPLSAIAINGVLVDNIHTPLKHGDRVVLMPPVCGG
ncbi:MoaD/ThiS family protein [Helicobacter baculiformis]|uniref:MoaD/ThiS family protein n=1 Tax=Helicobacter baculiformis TaxID=427351 RepID=A0ABV7ZJQ2_9HELI|nr:MoaD/ThiS family protein [Helicobacter baculiformis]